MSNLTKRFVKPKPDTHCVDEDTGKDVWSYSESLMQSILSETIDNFIADLKYRLQLPYGDEARIGPDDLMTELCSIKPSELTLMSAS